MNAKTKQKAKAVNPRNYKIGTRIAISALCAILIPVAILTPLLSFLSYSISSYFDFPSQSAPSSMSLLQWNQSIVTIKDELSSTNNDELKVFNTRTILYPIEQTGSLVYIDRNGEEFYCSVNNRQEVLDCAQSIMPSETDKDLNYFGENGILIISHTTSHDDNVYTLIIANTKSTFSDNNFNLDKNFIDLIFSRTGVIIICLAIIFAISIIGFSIFTSRTISTPIKKVSEGAKQIAKGNLDYKIDYHSTNEIGVLVDSFNDMTEQLKESIEIKNKVDESRKQTLAGIAHDLRTPLTSIKGYAEGLMDGIANTPEKQQKYLQTIYTSAVNTEKMLNDLLTISKFELGSITLNLKKISVKDFFNDCACDIKLALDKEGFDFEYIDNCDDNVFVNLDIDRFARVIRNIISNSVKYANKDIKGLIKLDVASYEKSVIINIEDNGIGIENDNLDKIFDSLYRVDPARTKVSQGSGIGLAVCKQIVELHGGRIWATSEIGKGLTIHISLDREVGE